ncbi:acyltransferase family protein [Camelimonas abortus]|uniref:Acyltransferase family protein n=1 Tax=Camelimonas abortus TaxID=1017184 RepID=A0ABV7LFR3_9HYPH
MPGSQTAHMRDHRDNFAAIRLVAAVMVIFGHAFPLTGASGPGYLGSPVSTVAVKVFFVISGYLIAGSWLQDSNLGRYLARRALRIFPGLAALCLLTVLVVGPVFTTLSLSEYFLNVNTWRYFNNVLLNPVYALPGVFAANVYPNAVNGSLWTLPVEFAMYLLLPLVMLMPARKYMLLVSAIVLSAGSLWFGRAFPLQTSPVFWGTSLVHALEMAPYFFWGAVYRAWAPREALNLQAGFLAMVVLVPFAKGAVGVEFTSLLLVPYLTLAFGYAQPPAFSWVERLGDPSYGTYLYGFLCQQVVAALSPMRDAPMLNFIFSLVPALVLGMLSWKLVEEPALRLKPRRKPSRPTGGMAAPARVVTGTRAP